MQSITVDLPAGYAATIVTDVYCTSQYSVIGDPSNNATAPTAISASTTTVLGAFSSNRRYLLEYSGSIPTVTTAFAGGTVNDDDTAYATLVSPTFTGVPVLPSGYKVGSTVITATAAEQNYVHGVTSALQTQLDTKAPAASPTFTGTPTIAKANGTEASNAVTASGAAGVITTSSLSAAAGTTYVITWTNTAILTTSIILLQHMGGTNTKDVSFKVERGSGSATLTINNLDLLAALDGTVLIGYVVV